MAYKKQNFVDGHVLTAEQLNHMENGIAAAMEAAENSVALDTTLSEEGKAADAAAIGAVLGDIETALDGILAIQYEFMGYSTFTLYHTTDVTGEKTTYQYREGMTWREWVESECNVDGFAFSAADELKTPAGKMVSYATEVEADGCIIIRDCIVPDNIIDPDTYFYLLE